MKPAAVRNLSGEASDGRSEERLMILIVRRSLMKVFTQINGIDAIFSKAGKELVCVGIGEIIAAAQPGILFSKGIDFSRGLDIGQRNMQGLQKFMKRNNRLNSFFHVLPFIYEGPVSIVERDHIVCRIDYAPSDRFIIGTLEFRY